MEQLFFEKNLGGYMSIGVNKLLSSLVLENNSKTQCKIKSFVILSLHNLLSRVRNQKYLIQVEFDKAHDDRVTLKECRLRILYAKSSMRLITLKY